MRPLPTLWFPSHSYTAPLPFAAPLKFLFIAGSIFSQGDQAPQLWRSLMSGKIFSGGALRSEEHTSELQSRPHLVCRLLLEKKQVESAQRGADQTPPAAVAQL